MTVSSVPLCYVLSGRFPYDRLISRDAGPAFAQSYGFPTATLSKVSLGESKVLVIDNRMHVDEMPRLKELVESASRNGTSVLLKIVDPVAPFPNADDYYYDFVHAMRDRTGVHYLTVYDPHLTAPDLFGNCRESRVFHLPYAYESAHELSAPFARRRKKIFLSGALGNVIYPLRSAAYRQWRRNPAGRYLFTYLNHPGYPDIGHVLKHDTIHEKFLDAMAKYKYAFVCSRREGIELQKYRDCAYAGCAPFGDLPAALRDCPQDAFIPFDGTMRSTLRAVYRGPDPQQVAANFRKYMRVRRDPAVLVARLEQQLTELLHV